MLIDSKLSKLSLCLITCLHSLLIVSSAAAESEDPRIAPMAPLSTIVLYNWEKEHCEVWDVPDAPLRALRNTANLVIVFVSDDKNRVFIGKNLLGIKHTCHSAYAGADSANPADYSGLDYITATWSEDGREVISLTHNEYHADRYKGKCKYKASMPCWYNSIVGLKSTDGGVNFSPSLKASLVAAPNFTQDVEQGRHRGFFNPSNVVQKDGYWYSMISTTGQGDQKAGICLFRTDNIHTLDEWRGFDGEGFSSRATNPYDNPKSRYIPCQPLPLGGIPGSISFHELTGKFVVVFPMGPADGIPDGGIGYQWSSDLIHWGPVRVMIALPSMTGPDCSITLRYSYPAIADPNSSARNFDIVGSRPYLFLTRFHTDGCDLPANRDLVAIELAISDNT